MRWRLGSRWKVFLLTLGVGLALDVARSINARTGYARPSEKWQPDPSRYQDLTWPPGAGLPKDTPLGARVFAQQCAVCHGPDGRGNGPASPSLVPAPRDFTVADYKYKSTPVGSPPSDADLRNVIANGLAASAMPYFKDLLSSEELDAVVQHVKGFSTVFAGAPPQALVVPPRVTADEASIQRGSELYASAGCGACHGADGRSWKRFEDGKGRLVRGRDLTAPWTFRGGADPVALWMRLTTGVGVMPSYAQVTTAEQRWDLTNYVLSLARTPPWEPGGRLEGPGHAKDRVARGDYLAHSEMCGLCHTQINSTGIYRGDDAYLAGGMRVGAYPHGNYVSKNLTGDLETGLGEKSVEEIATAITTGRTPERMLNNFSMIWPVFHRFSEQDAYAIADYLKSQPPVRNAVPPPLRYGFVETVVTKLRRPLPAAIPERLTYAEGNFGNLGLGPSRLQSALVLAQICVLGLGLILFFLAGPPGPRRTSWKAKVAMGAIGLGLIAFTGVLYELPSLSFIPPEQISATMFAGLPPLDPKDFKGKEDFALGERGRYLFTVNSCALCHTPTGAGGVKISWKPMGSLWSRNITPDEATGIGSWTDQQVARAIRSGISKDGRALHWQGMTWDHASNLDEEDVRAVIRWLRALPRVSHAIPPPFPPSEADCEVYTFFTLVDRDPKSGCFTTE